MEWVLHCDLICMQELSPCIGVVLANMIVARCLPPSYLTRRSIIIEVHNSPIFVLS